MDQAPLVDFCNQNSPRAQPPISRSPAGASEVALLRASQVAPPRRPSDATLASLPSCQPSKADPFGPHAPAHGRRAPFGPRDLQAGCAARPGFRRHQPSSHRSGAVRHRRMAPPVRALRRARAAGASPQPDPLGHLLSWDRGRAGWRARRSRGRAPHVRHARRSPRRSHPVGPARAGPPTLLRPASPVSAPACAFASSCACTPPSRPDGAEAPSDTRPRAQGRLTCPSAKRNGIRCTRGAFHQ